MPPKTDGHDSHATFTVPLGEIKFADSNAGGGQLTMRGHASVYDRPSHDLGGFRTKIAHGAFDGVLDTNPDVHLVIDHDTRYTLARTKNKTLELRSDPYGLHVWARMAPTSYAKDLAVLMERGDIDQMSFACDIGADEWFEDENGEITRTITEVSGLYDVTVCAQGAFPQTDASLVASFRQEPGDILASAIEAGRVPGRATPSTEGTDAAQDEQNDPADVSTVAARLAALKADATQRYAAQELPS